MGNKASKKSAKVAKKTVAKPVLLAGGNPQIAKADGDAPVQAYIAAMPGWTSDIGRRLDALTVRNVPHVRKAVKWNSPFYGIEGQGWFLNFHCFTKYVKVAFFRGTSVRPLPPGESKHKEVRYLDIHEDDQLDEAQFVAWVKQASQLPGEDLGLPVRGLSWQVHRLVGHGGGSCGSSHRSTKETTAVTPDQIIYQRRLRTLAAA
jgi:hypothetical protein